MDLICNLDTSLLKIRQLVIQNDVGTTDTNMTKTTNLLAQDPIRSTAWNLNSMRTQVSLSHSVGWGIHEFSSAEFFIDANYTTLRGTISADETLSQNSRLQLRITADDAVVFESDYVERATTFDFEIDISGVRFIYFHLLNSRPTPNAMHMTTGRFILGDLFLYE